MHLVCTLLIYLNFTSLEPLFYLNLTCNIEPLGPYDCPDVWKFQSWFLKTEFSLSGSWLKSSLESRGFWVDFFLLVFQHQRKGNNNNNKQQTTNQQTTNNNNNNNNKQQTTNNKQQTTNNKQQTTNNKQQTTNNKQQPSDVTSKFPWCCRASVLWSGKEALDVASDDRHRRAWDVPKFFQGKRPQNFHKKIHQGNQTPPKSTTNLKEGVVLDNFRWVPLLPLQLDQKRLPSFDT